jgi:hypothetical protein
MIARSTKVTKPRVKRIPGDPKDLALQLERAQTGLGSDYMVSEEATAFAEYGFSLGFGVQIMEGYGFGDSVGKHKLYHQILGIDDDGENWKDHRSPELALKMFYERLAQASEDNVTMKYRIWMCTPNSHVF